MATSGSAAIFRNSDRAGGGSTWPRCPGRGGRLPVPHLFSCVMGRGGILQANIAGMCGECLPCMDHTGFAPAQGSVCFPGLSRSGSGVLSKCPDLVGHVFCALPTSEQIRRPGA